MAKDKKYTKIGSIWQGKYGPVLFTGDEKAQNPDYQFEVQILVKDGKGNKKTVVKNPVLSLKDPREFENRAGKVPEKLLFEVSIVEET